MKKLLFEERKPLFVLLAIFTITCIATWGHCGDLLVDCGREAYIPYAVSQGKVLYKDIFCIYGSFAYLVNAFFFKIFSPNLNVLYVIGTIFSGFFILGTYFCSRFFLSKSISASVCIFLMYSIIFDNGIFNFIFPYSYAIVFAATFAIWILYFLLEYTKTKNTNLMYATFVLCGAIAVSKIDFIPVIIPALLLFLLYGENKKKEFLKLVAYFLIIPTVTFLVLFTQGMNIGDYLNNSSHLYSMLKSDSLKTFYSNYSIANFSIAHFRENFIELAITVILSAFYFLSSLYALRLKNKMLRYPLFGIITLFFFIIFFAQEEMPQKIFAMLPYICTLLFVSYFAKYLKLKDYKNSRLVSLLTLFFTAICCSIKNYHGLILGFYGAYSISALLIALIVFLKITLQENMLFNTKKQYEGVISAYLIILTLLFFIPLAHYIFYENTLVETKYGRHYASKGLAEPFGETIDYLSKNSTPQESMLVMPEGIMLNFLTGKKWDFYQTSFIPLDFDTFREDNIIKQIILKKPQYVVFTSRSTKEYGKDRICRDYAIDTCKYIVNNYNLEAAFGENFRIFLFKRMKEEPKNEEIQ